MAEPGVAFRQVSKLFGDVRAVSDLSFEIEDGEFLVLVGPSGCGKTTALRMVAGLEEASTGEISIGGRIVNHVPPRDRDIAMVFQSYALYPQMSVYENLAFGLKQRKTPKAEIDARVHEAAGMLGIAGLFARKPKELSGGQRQRVALGRAIVRRPKVFLMDEPLSNLDAHLRLHTRGEITALHRQLETTFIYVTHDQVEAMTMGTRIAVMKDGLLQQLDTPQRLYNRPVNTFVATFIGSPAMNLLTGEVVREGEVLTHTSAAGRVLLSPSAVDIGGQATLGIRPEQFERLPASRAALGTLTGTVTLVEPLGSDQYVTLDCAGNSVTARLDPSAPVALGEVIHLRPMLDTTHLFDTSTGHRLM